MLLSVCGHIETLQRKETLSFQHELKISKPTIPLPVCVASVVTKIPVQSEKLSLLSGESEGATPPSLLFCSPHLRLILITVRCIKRVDWGARVLRGQSGLTLDQIHTLSCTYTRGDELFPKAWTLSDLSLGFVSFRLSMPSHPSIY